jgi:hypothetical protein
MHALPDWLSRPAVGLLAAYGLTANVWAECPCNKGSQRIATLPVAQHVEHPDMLLDSAPLYQPGSPLPPVMTDGGTLPGPVQGAPLTGTTAVGSGVNRFAVSPPPGTLGQTYHRRSSLVPDDKHPRLGMVEVNLPEDVDVSARGMKAKWTGKVWRLETQEPLIPWVSHVYAIKAERRDKKTDEVVSTDVRWVRLIMGRVVYLEF